MTIWPFLETKKKKINLDIFSFFMSNKGLRKNKTLKHIIAKTNLEDSTYWLITRLNLAASLLPSFPIFGRTKTTKKTTHFDNNNKKNQKNFSPSRRKISKICQVGFLSSTQRKDFALMGFHCLLKWEWRASKKNLKCRESGSVIGALPSSTSSWRVCFVIFFKKNSYFSEKEEVTVGT